MTAIAPRLHNIPCPVLRTLVNEQRVAVGPDGQVRLEDLDRALKQIGISGLPRKVLVNGAKAQGKEQAGKLLTTLSEGQFNILKLTGGSLDHAGDTRILRGGFNQARLDWLLSFSSDGKRVTIDDMARAQKAAGRSENADLRANVLGIAELCAIVLVFGTPDARGKKGITNEALTSLYRDAKFPEGWTPGNLGAMELIGAMAKVGFTQAFTHSGRAQMGMDKALGRDELLDRTAVKGMQNAICPAGYKAPTQPAPLNAVEAAKLHGGA